jgi:hypothetical protein
MISSHSHINSSKDEQLLAATMLISDLEQQIEMLKKNNQEKDGEIEHLKKFVQDMFIE